MCYIKIVFNDFKLSCSITTKQKLKKFYSIIKNTKITNCKLSISDKLNDISKDIINFLHKENVMIRKLYIYEGNLDDDIIDKLAELANETLILDFYYSDINEFMSKYEIYLAKFYKIETLYCVNHYEEAINCKYINIVKFYYEEEDIEEINGQDYFYKSKKYYNVTDYNVSGFLAQNKLFSICTFDNKCTIFGNKWYNKFINNDKNITVPNLEGIEHLNILCDTKLVKDLLDNLPNGLKTLKITYKSWLSGEIDLINLPVTLEYLYLTHYDLQKCNIKLPFDCKIIQKKYFKELNNSTDNPKKNYCDCSD